MFVVRSTTCGTVVDMVGAALGHCILAVLHKGIICETSGGADPGTSTERERLSIDKRGGIAPPLDPFRHRIESRQTDDRP